MVHSIAVPGDAKDPTEDPDRTFVGDHSVITVNQPNKRSHRLEQIKGPGAPREFALEIEEMVVGRSAQAHICVESSLISRQHMKLTREGQVVQLSDLESANGVFLNGVKAHAARLHEGDNIQIGDVLFVYHEGD
jgi:hypothetical protein